MPHDFDAADPDRLQGLQSMERRVVVGLIVVFWCLFQAVFFIYDALDGPAPVALGVLLMQLLVYMTQPAEIMIAGAGGLLCYAAYVAMRCIRRLSIGRQLPLVAVIAIICATIFSLLVMSFCKLFSVVWADYSTRFHIIDTMRWLAPFGLWCSVALAVTHNTEMRDRERHLSSLRVQANEAQMRALRYQINPHFLYNTLNSIAALILDRRNDLAEAMVMRLSNFFRASLANDPLSNIALADELALQRLYLEIEQMRFPDNLHVDFDIAPDVSQARVPSLILQPLIENALKHGLNDAGKTTHLQVSARREQGLLVLEVADNGPATSHAASAGVGLASVSRRLVAHFGEAAKLDAHGDVDEGFIVRLMMPLHFA